MRSTLITGTGVPGRGLGLKYPTVTIAPDGEFKAEEGVYPVRGREGSQRDSASNGVYPVRGREGSQRDSASNGVYASRVRIEGEEETYKGATSIGVARTVGAEAPTIETHILDYEGELVGKRLSVELVQFLRPMERFSSLEELEEAISRDIARVRRLVYPHTH